MTRTFATMVAEATAVVPAVTVEELQQRLQQDPTLLIIDVRDSGDAHAGGSIPGAINIPYGTLLYAADNEVPPEWRDSRVQDRAHTVVTHCVAGPLGAIAAKALNDMGFANVSYLDGGIAAWQAAGKPIT